MRILLSADPEIPVPPLHYGGIERIVASLTAGLLARGHEVALAAHPDSNPATGCRLFPWPARRSQHRGDAWANMGALRQAVASFQPEVVHSFSRLLYLGHLLLRRKLPKIMSFQREPSGRTVRWAARLAGNSLMFTGCGEAISARGRQRGGGNWQTIHNFVDLASFDFSPSVPADAPLVFLSRIERIKGAHTAIAACRLAGRRLWLAGNHVEDESEHGRYWRDEILPELGRDGVEYVGPVDDAQKNRLLGQAAAMIVPIGWDEPFGIVFAEALACGTPVISCPRGALPEIVRPGVDGFLVKNVVEAAAAILRLPDLRREDCRDRAQSCFSKEVIVPQYETLYGRLIA
jgi:glycosyltransferase involved in cell wall biosynthesis